MNLIASPTLPKPGEAEVTRMAEIGAVALNALKSAALTAFHMLHP